MKQVLSLFTFGIAALFFLAFFTTLKPTVVAAASGPDKPRPVQHESSTFARLPLTDICHGIVARCRPAELTSAVQGSCARSLCDCKVPRGESCFPIVHYSNPTLIS
jgi:hypothetical protein